MTQPEILTHLRTLKQHYTFDQLAKRLDVPMVTVYRWLKTGRMHRLYVEYLTNKLPHVLE